MARPQRKRRIVPDLAGKVFTPGSPPDSAGAAIRLTLDGLEALRLADLDGLYQEEAARRMGVSRATFARVLSGARTTVAEALVHGKAVRIDGGAVERRASGRLPCPIHRRGPRRGRGCHCERYPGPEGLAGE